MAVEGPLLSLDRIGGAVFADDGGVIDTERVHVGAWKRCLDEHLRRRGRELGRSLAPFEVPADYLRYFDGEVDGAGVRAFLDSRGLDEDDAPALVEREASYFLQEVDRWG